MVDGHALDRVGRFLIEKQFQEILTPQPVRGGQMLFDALGLLGQLLVQVVALTRQGVQFGAHARERRVGGVDAQAHLGNLLVFGLYVPQPAHPLPFCFGEPRVECIELLDHIHQLGFRLFPVERFCRLRMWV